MSDETSAPLARRLAALLYDALLLAGLLFVFTLVLIFARGRPGDRGRNALVRGEPPRGRVRVLRSVVDARRADRGHEGWRIRVVAGRAESVDWPHAALRFFASWLSLLPAGAGYWWALVDRERCCWHDRLSGTRVIRTSAAAERSPALSGPSRRGPPSRPAARRSAPKRLSLGRR